MNRYQESQSAREDNKTKAVRWIRNSIVGIVGAFALFVTGMSSWIYVEGGEFVRVLNPSGGYTWHTTQGIKFKVPFLSRTERFNQFSTVTMLREEDRTSSVEAQPHMIAFADTYTGHMEATFRYSIAPNPETLEAMYQATKTQENLNRNTLLSHARNLLTYTANQVYGEDFMQGGQNDFLTRLYFQGENGLFITERVKETITQEAGFSDLENFEANSGEATTNEGFVWKVRRLQNDDGTYQTQENVLAKFGISLELINLVAFHPEERLTAFINKKKDFIAKRAEIIEGQRNEREAAITAKLEGERKRVEARNVQLIQKDAAVIAEEKKVEVEKQQAELARVQKQKELEIAEANEGIQKANFAAAQYEAQAILETGLAQAKVSEAKYKALNNPVYLRELEKGQAEALYRALPQMPTVQMPYIVNGGAGGSAEGGVQQSLDQLTSLSVLNGLGIALPKAAVSEAK